MLFFVYQMPAGNTLPKGVIERETFQATDSRLNVFKVERLPKTFYVHPNYFCAHACISRSLFVILDFYLSNPQKFSSPLSPLTFE
jgi:hypothetical protein